MKRCPPFVVAFATLLHGAWAALLFVDGNVINITALSIFGSVLPAALLLAASAVLSGASFFVKRRSSRAALLLPQQFLLMMSAGGAMVAMLVGHYADGVIRDRLFIIADQMHLPVLAALHAGMIVMIAWGDR